MKRVELKKQADAKAGYGFSGLGIPIGQPFNVVNELKCKVTALVTQRYSKVIL